MYRHTGSSNVIDTLCSHFTLTDGVPKCGTSPVLTPNFLFKHGFSKPDNPFMI